MSLVQVNGRGWSFQWLVMAPMALVGLLTEAKLPRRIAWRMMTEKKHSTRLSQEQLVGTKCRVIRRLAGRPSQARTSACLCGVVVADHVQFLARVAGGDFLEGAQELIVPAAG